MRYFLVIILLGLSLGQIVGKTYLSIVNGPFLDYWVYKGAATAWINGENPFAKQYSLNQSVPFNYPPTVLPFLTPLTNISEPLGSFLYALASMLAFALSSYLIWQIAQTHQTAISGKKWWFLLVIAFTMQTHFFKLNATLGQINLFVLLLILLSLWWYKNQKLLLSAIMISSGVAIKLIPILITPFLIKPEIKRLRRKDFATIAMIIILTASLGWYFWSRELSYYIVTLMPQLYPSLGVLGAHDQSLY